MKTAEEILESHLTSMLSRTEDSYVTIEEMKQVPEFEACVKAIEQAQKEAYNEAIDDAAKNATLEYVELGLGEYYEVNKQSILKLKK